MLECIDAADGVMGVGGCHEPDWPFCRSDVRLCSSMMRALSCMFELLYNAVGEARRDWYCCRGSKHVAPRVRLSSSAGPRWADLSLVVLSVWGVTSSEALLQTGPGVNGMCFQ